MTVSWTRRRFLATAGRTAAGVLATAAAARAASPRPAMQRTPADGAAPAAASKRRGAGGVAASAAVDAARADLRRLITERALVVDDPWVLMHAVLPLGADVRHGSEPVLDFVVRTWSESVTTGGTTYPRFPLAVEAHPNHFLEVMYAADVPPTRAFATRGGTITRADLTRGALALFSPAVQGDELSWTVSIFTAEMRPEADRFRNAEGREFTVGAVVEATAQAAEAGYADTMAAMRGTKAYGRSAIQEYACNGTHVVYAVLDAVRNGYRANHLAERATTLMRAALFRLGPEVTLIDQVIGGSGAPGARLNADGAKLQFLGHSLENLRFARRHRLFDPSADERTAVAAAEQELAAVAHRLATGSDLDALARQVPRAYSVILGDACHALHALEGDAA
jgi:hypothetical protein